MKSQNYKTLIYIFLAGFIIRLIYLIFFFGLQVISNPDSYEYLDYAENLVAGRGYISGQWRAFRAPGYPFFIAAVYSVFGSSIAVLKIIQVLISSFIPVIVYLIGFRISGKRVAIISGVLACFYFGLVNEPAHILSESTFTFLFALSILLLLYVEKHKIYTVLSGVVLAITALTRPVGLLIVPVAILWIIIKFPAKTALKSCMLMLIGFILTMSPWWIRNYYLFNAFVPVCLETGYVLKHVHVPKADMFKFDYLPELERDRQNFKEGLDFLKTQSLSALIKKGFLNFLTFLYPFMPTYDFTYVIIFPFWLFGIYFVIKSKNIQAMLMFSMFIYFPVAFAFCGTTRYRHSIGPYFILLAALGIETILNRLKTRKDVNTAWFVSAVWLGINVLIFIYSEPIRLVVRKIKNI